MTARLIALLPLLYASLVLAEPGPDADAIQTCHNIGKMGEAIMQDRQNGVPMAAQAAAIRESIPEDDQETADFVSEVIKEAHNRPQVEDLAGRSAVSRQFGRDLFEGCMEGVAAHNPPT